MEKYKVIDRSKETGSTHSLINKGMIPGIVYGKGTEPTKIAFENKILLKLMHTGSFYSTILDIDIDGKSEKVLPKQLQYHPVTDKLIHFDFLRVQDDTKVIRKRRWSVHYHAKPPKVITKQHWMLPMCS